MIAFVSMAIRFGILFLSFLGYFLWLKDRYGIRQELIPVMICTGIGNMMFLGGIWNIMPLSVVLIWGFGLLQLRYLKNIKQCLSDQTFVWRVGGFFLVCVLFAFLMRGAVLTHYDNFSHWALVVKEMLSHDRLPNFESELIMFRSYPTGTAGFIYFVCKLLGETDGCMAYAQLLLLLSCIFTFTACLNLENRYLSPLLFGGGVYFLVSGIKITELLVDTLLPLLGLAGIVIIFYYRTDLIRAAFLVSPILIFLNCVKNSGVYFWLINAAFFIYLAVRFHVFKRVWKAFTIFAILFPAMFIYLWRQHVNYVFPKGAISKHEMSLNSYKSIIAKKEWKDIIGITKNILQETLSLQNQSIRMLIVIVLILAAGYMLSSYRKKKYCKSREAQIVLLCVGSYCFYTVGLLGMYLFSMPVGEARELASYVRYNRTITVFLYGILLLYVLNYFPRFKKNSLPGIVSHSLVALLVLSPIWEYRNVIKSLWDRSGKENTIHYQMEELKRSYLIPTGKKYFIYISDIPDSAGYCYYLAKYVLSSNEVTVWNRDMLQDNLEELRECDYLIVFRQDEEMSMVMEDNGLPMDERVINLRQLREGK